MADEDRPAAPDDGRSASDDNGSDWFFRDRSRDDESQAAQPGRDDYRPGPDQYPDAAPTQYYGPFGGPARPVDEPTQVLPSHGAAPPPPTFAHPTGYPAASGVPPLTTPPVRPASAAAAPAQTPPKQPARRSSDRSDPGGCRTAGALVGTAAGYGGARLAQTGAPAVAPSVPDPTDRRSSADDEPSSADPQSPVPAAPSQIDTVQVAAAALPSTVMIRVGSSGSGGTGSGFVLDTEGHIMTNNHVIADAADGGRIIVMFSDGARVRAELVGRSPSLRSGDHQADRFAPAHPVAGRATPTAVRVGEPVVAIGSPLALASTVTQGIVSAKNRPVVVNSDGGADSPSAYINGDPDRCRHQPRQLGRTAGRRRGPGGRGELGHPDPRPEPRHQRQHRARLRHPDQPGDGDRQAADRGRQGDATR